MKNINEFYRNTEKYMLVDGDGEFNFGDTNVLPKATIIKMEKIYEKHK